MNTDAHLDDGALLRYLDGEEISASQVNHLASCDTCKARLSTFGERSALLDAFLFEAAEEDGRPEYEAAFLERIGMRGRRLGKHSGSPLGALRRATPSGSLRWAAAIALLGVALGFAPVRAWVARVATTVWETVVASESGLDDPPDASGSTEVAVPLTGSRILVRLEGDRFPGRLVVASADGDELRARLEGPDGGEILVLPGGVQVAASSARSDLFLDLPSGVSELVLQVGDSVLETWRSDAWEDQALVRILVGDGG